MLRVARPFVGRHIVEGVLREVLGLSYHEMCDKFARLYARLSIKILCEKKIYIYITCNYLTMSFNLCTTLNVHQKQKSLYKEISISRIISYYNFYIIILYKEYAIYNIYIQKRL